MNEFDWRRISKQALGAILVTCLTLGLILAKTWRQPSRKVLTSFSWKHLGLAVCLLILSSLVDTVRVKVMARAAGERVSFLVGLRTVLAGYFIAAVTPFVAGGAPVQAYSLYLGGIPLGKATGIVLVSGFLAQWLLTIMAAVLVFGFGLQVGPTPILQGIIKLGVLVYAVGWVVIFYLAWNLEKATPIVEWCFRLLVKARIVSESWVQGAVAKTTAFLAEVARSFQGVFSGGFFYMLLGGLAYLVIFALNFTVAPVLMAGLGREVDYWLLMALQVPVYLLVSVVPTPGGSGGLEAGLAMIMSHHLGGHELGLFVAGWRLLILYFHLISGGLGLLAVFGPGRKKGGSS